MSAAGSQQNPTQASVTEMKTQTGDKVSKEKCHPSGCPRRDRFRQAKPESLHREGELGVQGNTKGLSRLNLQIHLQMLKNHNRRNRTQTVFHQH